MSDDDDSPETLKDLGHMFETAMKYPDLPDNLYEVFSLLASAFLEYKEAAGERGWAANIRKVDGSPALTEKEAETLESALASHKEQLGMLMRGGGSSGGDAEEPRGVETLEETKERQAAEAAAKAAAEKTTAAAKESAAIDSKKATDALLARAGTAIDPRAVSLDAIVEQVHELLLGYKRQAHELARQYGIIKFQKTMPVLPIPGTPITVPTNLLIIIIQGVLEFLRIFAAFTDFPGSGLVGVFSTVAAALIEAGKGDITAAALTIVGVAGKYPTAIGAAVKVVEKVFSFIAEDYADELFWAGYRSAKSWLVGLVAFLFSVFAPLPVRKIGEGMLDKFNELLDEVARKQEAVKDAIGEDTYPLKCFNVRWQDIDAMHIDFDNMATLQTLFHMPEFFCNARVRTLVKNFSYIPPLRFIVEMLGLPTTEGGLRRQCMGLPQEVIDGNLVTAVVSALKPDVALKPDDERPDGCPRAGSEAELSQMIAAAQQKLAGTFSGGSRGKSRSKKSQPTPEDKEFWLKLRAELAAAAAAATP
jgi:hypothetical protein